MGAEAKSHPAHNYGFTSTFDTGETEREWEQKLKAIALF